MGAIEHAGRRRWAAMSSAAPTAGWSASPTTPAATGTARSARAWPAPTGWRRGRPSCCRCPTSTSSSRCRRRSAAIAFQNKATVYAILFRAAAETLRTHRRRSAPPRRRDRRHRRAAHLGAGAARTIPTSIASSRAAACRPTARAGSPAGPASSCRSACSRACSAGCSSSGCAPPSTPANCASSASSPRLAEPARLRRAICAELRRIDWVVYAKPPFGGPEQVLAYLGRYTHRVAIANSRLVASTTTPSAFRWKDYRQHGKPQGHDARRRRVHPPLPAAHPAGRLPSHPPLSASSPTATALPSSRSAAGCSPHRHRSRTTPRPDYRERRPPSAPGTIRRLPLLRRRHAHVDRCTSPPPLPAVAGATAHEQRPSPSDSRRSSRTARRVSPGRHALCRCAVLRSASADQSHRDRDRAAIASLRACRTAGQQRHAAGTPSSLRPARRRSQTQRRHSTQSP